MIDFFAEWCIACKELDKKTYVDDAVRKEAQRFVAIKVDSTKDSDALKLLLARFKVGGLPRVLFVDGRGNVLENPDVQGFVEAPDYLALMKRVR
jgi:thiol:disulfide interchange protein DsbD